MFIKYICFSLLTIVFFLGEPLIGSDKLLIENDIQKVSKKRVLVLDADGIHAIGIAKMLEKMEKATGKKTLESFDMIIGESMGGVLALYLSQGKSANQFIDEFSKFSKNFFYRNLFKRMFGIKSFSTSLYEQYLKKLLGNGSLKNVEKPIFISVYDNRYGEYLALSKDNNMKLWELARATTTIKEKYYPISFDHEGISRFSNNSVEQKMNVSVLAYDMAKKSFPGEEIQLIKIKAGAPKTKMSYESHIDQLIDEAENVSNIDDIYIDLKSDLSPFDYSDLSIQRIYTATESAIYFYKKNLIKLLIEIPYPNKDG